MAEVDIIIPYFNAEKTIDRCLASIAMQTTANHVHVMIADDCSETPPYKAVEYWNRVLDVQYIRLDKNKGPGQARQEAMDETDSEYIMFVDADDTLASAFAVEKLVYGIENAGADIVCGDFYEETAQHTFVKHGENPVWVFGKIYRRRFLERFKIRFNDSRANEDTGLNTVAYNLTDKAVHIPQVVYNWHYAEGTITRSNNAVYGWGTGHLGYVENMAWAVDELTRRDVNAEIVRSLAVRSLCRMYFMHEDILACHPEYATQSMDAIKDYVMSAIHPIQADGALQFCYVSEAFAEIANKVMKDERQAGIMHKMTFRDFLRAVGCGF